METASRWSRVLVSTEMLLMRTCTSFQTSKRCLLGQTSIRSEFSSWAASLAVAVQFWSVYKDPQARMSVIDTREYPETGVYHVPNLHSVGLAGTEYAHEYLIHGIVDGGLGYNLVPVTDWSTKASMPGYSSYSLLFAWPHQAHSSR